MIGQIFEALTNAIEESVGLALAAAFVWGVLSIVLSPCHLASIPLIVGFINGQENINPRRALAISTLFAVGILLTIAVIGVVTAATGRILGDVGVIGNYIVAVVFFVMGLHLLNVISMPWSSPAVASVKRKGLVAAFMLGLIFGVAIGPCTFAYMAPMLGVTFKLSASNLPYGITLLLLYGVGHCSVIVIAGTFTGLVQNYLNWNKQAKGAVILRGLCGVMVILGGLWLIYTTA